MEAMRTKCTVLTKILSEGKKKKKKREKSLDLDIIYTSVS
jgi:hypothetical protein